MDRGGHKICDTANPLWERACSRMLCIRRRGFGMCRPHREQALLLRFGGVHPTREHPISVGAKLARDGVLKNSVIIPAIGDVLLDPRCIRILPRRKFALQVPRKRNDLCDRAIQLLRNAVPQLHARQQSYQLGVFVDRHFLVAGDPESFFGRFFVVKAGVWVPSYSNAFWLGSNRTEGDRLIDSDTEGDGKCLNLLPVLRQKLQCPNPVPIFFWDPADL
jgi:hypothetical protein